jgi:hypothetical protein
MTRRTTVTMTTVTTTTTMTMMNRLPQRGAKPPDRHPVLREVRRERSSATRLISVRMKRKRKTTTTTMVMATAARKANRKNLPRNERLRNPLHPAKPQQQLRRRQRQHRRPRRMLLRGRRRSSPVVSYQTRMATTTRCADDCTSLCATNT